MAEEQTEQVNDADTAVQEDKTEAQEDKTEVQEGKTAVGSAEFAEVQESESSGQENLDLLLDIHMPITVTLGKAHIPLRRLLQLGPGSVLGLDKSIGQPAELYVQDICFATGDIVVVNDSFAVRIRELCGTEELKSTGAGA